MRLVRTALLVAVTVSLSIGQTTTGTGVSRASWLEKTERTVGGPEADLVVRTGDINNLGFGWPADFDLFSGNSTPPHGFPWKAPAGAPSGTDRIMLGTAVTPRDVQTRAGDGYAGRTARADTKPQAITLDIGAMPSKVEAVVIQMFLDDFQAPVWHSHFQVSLNGMRIATFESAVNALQQTGPIGKLVTLKLLPEYWLLLQSGKLNVLIDDPTTHAPDGYAVDFIRILINPHPFKYQVSLKAFVFDAETHQPISGAAVNAALASGKTDQAGQCALTGVPAGLVVAIASSPGYDDAVVPVDLVAGQNGETRMQLHRHGESAADLAKSIAANGSAAIYGIHFDTNQAALQAASQPALDAILSLINGQAGSRWIIAGHTDNRGGAEYNLRLSKARADAVVAWLTAHGVAQSRLVAQGFGANKPVADNATEGGQALNRRVEIEPVKAQ